MITNTLSRLYNMTIYQDMEKRGPQLLWLISITHVDVIHVHALAQYTEVLCTQRVRTGQSGSTSLLIRLKLKKYVYMTWYSARCIEIIHTIQISSAVNTDKYSRLSAPKFNHFWESLASFSQLLSWQDFMAYLNEVYHARTKGPCIGLGCLTETLPVTSCW